MDRPLVTRLVPGLVALLLLVGVTACGDDSTDSGDSATTTQAEGTTAASVELVDTDLGEVLADSESGFTLYAFSPDTETTSACNDACAEAWPPLPGPAEAGDGADADQLGTITRDDGSTQATYGGHPLYMFAGDSARGDTTGQGSGDKWFVISASGETVTDAPADGTTTTEAGDRYGY